MNVPFVWPQWLTAPWIIRDQDGEWWCFENEPQLTKEYWRVTSGDVISLAPWAFDIPFPDVPWQESKMQNPHRSDPCSGD